MTDSNQEKNYYTVTVTCDDTITGGTSPYLIYQNISETHKIHLSKNFDGIKFQIDKDNSPKKFIFTGANILPTVHGDNIYPDLKIAAVLEDVVYIDDHQLNTNAETVGNITLFFILKNAADEQETVAGKRKVHLSSDPEVINTGVVP